MCSFLNIYLQRQYFVDLKQVRTIGGKGGDGAISFLQLFANEFAGPDGGDGGNGGHVVFEVCFRRSPLCAILIIHILTWFILVGNNIRQ